MRTLSIFIVVLMSTLVAGAQIKYSTYENGRFGFSIDYPSTFVMQPPGVTGDGRIFLSKDKQVEMRAWGQYNALFRSVQEEFDEALKSYGGRVNYKRKLEDSFVISGIKAGRIFYQKTLYHKFKSTDVFFTFTIEYPEAQRKVYDTVIEKISRSFRFDPNFDV